VIGLAVLRSLSALSMVKEVGEDWSTSESVPKTEMGMEMGIVERAVREWLSSSKAYEGGCVRRNDMMSRRDFFPFFFERPIPCSPGDVMLLSACPVSVLYVE
jgi:hypothetical protein